MSYNGGGIRIEDIGYGNIPYSVQPNVNEMILTTNTFSVNGEVQNYDNNLLEGADGNIVIGPFYDTIMSIEINGVNYSMSDLGFTAEDYIERTFEYKKYGSEGWNRVEVNSNNVNSTEYKHHLATFIGGSADFGSTPFNGDVIRMNNYYINSFYSKDIMSSLERDNIFAVIDKEMIISVNEIRDSCFKDSKYLERLVIGSHNIGDYAFSNCSNLKEIVLFNFSLAGPTHTISDTAFEGIANNGVVKFTNVYDWTEEWINNYLLPKLPSGWTYVLN